MAIALVPTEPPLNRLGLIAARLAFLVPSALLIGLGTAAGAFVMGIVIPLTLFLITAIIFDDMGGPLFWPIFVMMMLMIGTGVGFVFSVLWVLMFALLRLFILPRYRPAQ